MPAVAMLQGLKSIIELHRITNLDRHINHEAGNARL
jgi:hypothetical protein